MRRGDWPRAALLAAALTALSPAAGAQALTGAAGAEVSVCFTPGAKCEAFIAAAIDLARTDIRVQAYGFSSRPILEALIAAKRRGVDVEVILDRFSVAYAGAVSVSGAGIPIWVDAARSIAHNKIVVVDSRITLTGSMNFSRNAAQNNAENVVRIDSPEVARWYLDNWLIRRDSARPYDREHPNPPR